MNGKRDWCPIPATSCDTNLCVFRCTKCTIPTILICSHSHSHLWHLDARTHAPTYLPTTALSLFLFSPTSHTNNIRGSFILLLLLYTCVCVIIPLSCLPSPFSLFLLLFLSLVHSCSLFLSFSLSFCSLFHLTALSSLLFQWLLAWCSNRNIHQLKSNHNLRLHGTTAIGNLLTSITQHWTKWMLKQGPSLLLWLIRNLSRYVSVKCLALCSVFLFLSSLSICVCLSPLSFFPPTSTYRHTHPYTCTYAHSHPTPFVPSQGENMSAKIHSLLDHNYRSRPWHYYDQQQTKWQQQ